MGEWQVSTSECRTRDGDTDTVTVTPQPPFTLRFVSRRRAVLVTEQGERSFYDYRVSVDTLSGGRSSSEIRFSPYEERVAGFFYVCDDAIRINRRGGCTTWLSKQ